MQVYLWAVETPQNTERQSWNEEERLAGRPAAVWTWLKLMTHVTIAAFCLPDGREGAAAQQGYQGCRQPGVDDEVGGCTAGADALYVLQDSHLPGTAFSAPSPEGLPLCLFDTVCQNSAPSTAFTRAIDLN